MDIQCMHIRIYIYTHKYTYILCKYIMGRIIVYLGLKISTNAFVLGTYKTYIRIPMLTV